MSPEELPRAAFSIPQFIYEPMFWFATFGAAMLRAVFAEPRTTFVVLVSFFAAMFSAIVFTEPVVEWRSLTGGWVWAAAAVISLTGEHFMRFVLKMIGRLSEKLEQDPAYLLTLIDKWRGKGR